MIWFNSSDWIWVLITSFTSNVSGSFFLTLFTLVVFLIVLMLMFRIPIEFTAIFILPFLIVLMAFTQEFLAVGGVITIYLAILLARFWIFR